MIKKFLIVGVLSISIFATASMEWTRWDLVRVVDSRTLVVKSDKGELRTVSLAGIGVVPDESAATNFIHKTVSGREIQFWPIDTAHTNWYERSMCVFYDFERGRGGSVVSDFPMLNEDMLKRGFASFKSSPVTGDMYKLNARLRKAAKPRLERDN